MTSILFCCIKLTRRNSPVTKAELDALFAGFGVIVGLSIFRNDDKLKCFIQFDSPASVVSALSTLNNAKHPIGKIKLYFSHKTRILNSDELNNIKESKSFESEKLVDRPSNQTDFSDRVGAESREVNVKNARVSPRESQQNGNPAAGFWPTPQSHSHCDHLSTNPSRSGINLHSNFPSNATIPSFSEYQKFCRPTYSQNANPLLIAPATTSNTKAILLTDFFINLVNAKTFANLFGCFGNVDQVFHNRRLGKTIIWFEDIDGATKAMHNLNGFRFFHTLLNLCYVPENYAEFIPDFDPRVWPELSILSGHSRYYRFKDNLKIRINTVSSMLHFTGIDSDLTIDVLYIIISKIAEPTRMFLLSERSYGSRMYLVEFRDVSDAAQVLSVLHNKHVGNKLLKCSFSHTKIENYL